MRAVVVDTHLTRGKTERMIAFVTSYAAADAVVVLTKRVAK
jgi:hypothetical protein